MISLTDGNIIRKLSRTNGTLYNAIVFGITNKVYSL